MDRPNPQPVERYPWWELTSDPSLQQGDLLQGFKLVYPTVQPNPAGEPASIAAKEGTFDLIVMTQSCDVGRGKVDSILLCPWWDLRTFVNAATSKGLNWGREQREKLHQGLLPGYHLLNEAQFAEVHIDLGIVDFKQVYTAPLEIIERFLQTRGNRLRLLPPYREHLAQAFARFFMRVGLPVDIPAEKLKRLPK